MNKNIIITISAFVFILIAASAHAYEYSGTIRFASVIGSPVSNIPSGTYDSIQYIELKMDGPKEIRYTVNGEEPSCASSTKYTAPIVVDKSQKIRAISCYYDNAKSEISNFDYIINLKTEGNTASGGYPKKDVQNGEVLGASTEYGRVVGSCPKYLNTNIVLGFKNNVDDVLRLQKFLNRELGLQIPLTGYFGKLSSTAVSNFQELYKESILGKNYTGKGTGNVYNMTRSKIDRIECLRKMESGDVK